MSRVLSSSVSFLYDCLEYDLDLGREREREREREEWKSLDCFDW
jgi:hypothetical protein